MGQEEAHELRLGALVRLTSPDILHELLGPEGSFDFDNMNLLVDLWMKASAERTDLVVK